MVRLRLKRLGTKKKPHFRIVAIERRRARDSKALEELGYYDPSKQPPFLKLDVERAKGWLARGAQPSDIVRALLKKAGYQVSK